MSRPLDELAAEQAAAAIPPPVREAGASPGIDRPRSATTSASVAAAPETATSVGASPADTGTRSAQGTGAPSPSREQATGPAAAPQSTDAATAAVATPSALVPAATVAPAAAAKIASVGTPQPMPESPGSAGAIGGAVFALLLVVGLILALAWLAKRMPGVAGSSNAALRVVASLSLGPRERVVVVAVGDSQLLLSVGAGGTRTLHTLETPLAMTDAAPSAFATLLAQQFGKKA